MGEVEEEARGSARQAEEWRREHEDALRELGEQREAMRCLELEKQKIRSAMEEECVEKERLAVERIHRAEE